jgi:apolipoprotein N-acyltransferase
MATTRKKKETAVKTGRARKTLRVADPIAQADHAIDLEKKWYQKPFWFSLTGALLLWAAFAPIGAWPLVWMATVPWIILIAKQDALDVKRPYLKIWLAGWIHWALLAFFVTLPHWAGWFGWVAMAAVLGFFLPLFVLFGRSMVYAMRVPLFLAAPVAWVALELLRGYLFTGYSMALLPHAMFKVPILIQTADLFGGYGTSFLIVMTTAIAAQVFFDRDQIKMWLRLGGVAAILAFIVGYGAFRLNEKTEMGDRVFRVALIQGSIDVIFAKTPEEALRNYENQIDQYRQLTIDARQQFGDLDLIVWPESCFPGEYLEMAGLPTNNEQKLSVVSVMQGAGRMANEPDNVIVFRDLEKMLVGTSVEDPETNDLFNATLLIYADGQIAAEYHKNHRVMFGEYLPFGKWLPWLEDMMPNGRSLTPGIRPEVAEVDGFKIAPSICFESTVPHLVRRHLNQLAAEGDEPDAMANLTNDGWFFGSNCLDQHLACNVFRAVEMRKQAMVAANTGFSAHVDSAGRLIEVGPRRDTAVILAEMRKEKRTSLYRVVGDWPAMICVAISFVAVIVLIRKRKPGSG